MKELVSEERLEILVTQEMRRADLLPENRLGNEGQERHARAERRMAKQVARAALDELGVEVLLEVGLEEPYLCPLVERQEDGEDECECWDAVDRHDMPTTCSRTIYGNEVPRGKPRFSASEKCPLRKGPVLVRAKGKA